MSKIKTFLQNVNERFQTFCKSVNDNKTTIMLVVLISASVYMGYSFSQYNYSRHANEYKLDNVREYIYNPSMYQVDTLYRKCGDTLFIDTVRVNYRKQ